MDLFVRSFLDDEGIDFVNLMFEWVFYFLVKVKNVIFFYMVGLLLYLDLFDYKLELIKRIGEDCLGEYFEGK